MGIIILKEIVQCAIKKNHFLVITIWILGYPITELKCKCKEGEYYYEDICQECPSGTFIYKEEKTCVSECPLGYIVNVLSNECEVKPPPEPEDPPTPPEPEKPKEDYTE